MKNIVVIIPYFGILPNNFKVWVNSCARSPMVDFKLITDIKINTDILPPNIEVIKMKFEDIKKIFEKKLNKKILMDAPYKLCDFKPMYGDIFYDKIKEYEYWGYCDLDMIFGNIMKFLNAYDYKKYDKFLKLGHFSIYRNSKENNKRYLLSPNYEKIFMTNKTIGFDEINGINDVFYERKIPFFDKTIFADISFLNERFRLSFNEKNYKYQIFYKKENGIYRRHWVGDTYEDDEYIYIHIQRRKLINYTNDNIKDNLITKKGLIELKDEPTMKDVIQYNNYYGNIYEKIEKKCRRLNIIIKKRTNKNKYKH